MQKYIQIIALFGLVFLIACHNRNCCTIDAPRPIQYPKQAEMSMPVVEKNTTFVEPTIVAGSAESEGELAKIPEDSSMASRPAVTVETTGEIKGTFGSNEVPGIQTSTHDTVDPVEVGETTKYILEVLNSGVQDAKNIKVTAIIPTETSFVSATVEGYSTPISHTLQDKIIQFDAVPTLGPKEKVKYEVKVVVEVASDMIHTFEIESDDFGKKITKQEGTKSIQPK